MDTNEYPLAVVMCDCLRVTLALGPDDEAVTLPDGFGIQAGTCERCYAEVKAYASTEPRAYLIGDTKYVGALTKRIEIKYVEVTPEDRAASLLAAYMRAAMRKAGFRIY